MAEQIQYPYLDDAERDIIESYRNGEWTPVSESEYASKIAVLRAAARSRLGLPPADASPIPRRRALPALRLRNQTIAQTASGSSKEQ